MLIYMESAGGEQYAAFSSDLLPRAGDVLRLVRTSSGDPVVSEYRVTHAPYHWAIQNTAIGETTARIVTITVERLARREGDVP